MKAVIVNMDMEPITIVELTPAMQAALAEHRQLVLAVNQALSPTAEPDCIEALNVITVVTYPLCRQLTILQTPNEIDALGLDAAFLAGQSRLVNGVHAKGRAVGFNDALRVLSGIGRQLSEGRD